MNVLFYLEINFVGLVMLAVMLNNQHKSAGLAADQKMFNYMVITMMVMLVLDSGMWALDGKQFPFSRGINYIVSTAYYFLNVFIPFIWLLYTLVALNMDSFTVGKYKGLIFVPLVINTILIVANLFTHSIFSISEQNQYARGEGFFVPVLLAFFYLLWATAIALKRAVKAGTRFERKKCISIMAFMILPVLAGIVQSFFYGVSLIWICAVLSLLMIFVNFQNRQITTDVLTGLNNRYQFNRYLARTVGNARENVPHSLILIDIDQFKQINDRYGHLNGDKALMIVSDILQKSSADTDAFLSRFGGDEFTIICKTIYVKPLINQIERTIAAFNQSKKETFFLSLSIGRADLKGGTTKDPDDLISRADKDMYQKKQSKQIH